MRDGVCAVGERLDCRDADKSILVTMFVFFVAACGVFVFRMSYIAGGPWVTSNFRFDVSNPVKTFPPLWSSAVRIAERVDLLVLRSPGSVLTVSFFLCEICRNHQYSPMLIS